MRRRAARLAVALAALAVSLAWPPLAEAIDVEDSATAAAGLRLEGAGEDDASGQVAPAGDVNHDGKEDLVVGARGADYNGRKDSGAAYVVYGGGGDGALDLRRLGSRGFRIDGAATGDQLGSSVSAAGDVNGDGHDDVIVGAPGASGFAGAAYVVLGAARADLLDVDLAFAGAGQAMAIRGAAAGDGLGVSVAGVGGDVNNDGRRDVVVGAPGADNRGRASSGSAYVIYGRAATDAVDAASLGSRGLRLDGDAAAVGAGVSVAGAGDVNDDGRADLVVGAPAFALNGASGAGSATVVYGWGGINDPADLDLASVGSRGFRIKGAVGHLTGIAVAAAGDANGDGRDDVVVGSPGWPGGGAAEVVYGEHSADPGDVLQASLGSRGFRVTGQDGANMAVGLAVGGGADVNGDGREDLVVGAPLAGAGAGAAYVVYGRSGGDPADLAAGTLGEGGFAIAGAPVERAGSSVALLPDLTGDGGGDVVVGAPQSVQEGLRAGAAYVVRGEPESVDVRLEGTRVDPEGTGGVPRLAELRVTLSAPRRVPVRFGFGTVGNSGTAKAPGDYTSTSGTLQIEPGDTDATIRVPVAGDALDEPDETFQVVLHTVENGTLKSGPATVTIADDDDPPRVSAVDAEAAEGGSASVKVRLDAPSGRTVRVGYATAPGSAGSADFTAGAGTLSYSPGQVERTVAVPLADDELDEDDETLELALSAPVDATIAGASAAVTIRDGDPPPGVSIEALPGVTPPGQEPLPPGHVREGGLVTGFVSLDGPSGKAVRVRVSSGGGGAEPGADYEPVDRVVALAPGSFGAFVSVALPDDALDEDDETFALSLAGVENAGPTGEALAVTIVDDDPPPSASIEADVAAPERGPGARAGARLAVRLDAPSGREVRVRFDTAGASAAGGADYGAASGTLAFPPGVTERELAVDVLGDALDEDDETLSVLLSEPVNATLGRAAGTVTIVDDDDSPRVSAVDAVATEGWFASVKVSLDAASGRTVRVSYAAVAGSAGAGDFTATSGTLTFAPGVRERTVGVVLGSDDLDEEDETLELVLSAPVNASVADGSATVTVRDTDPPPAVSIGPELEAPAGGESPAGVEIAEGGDGVALVSMERPSAKAVRVRVSSGGGEAAPGGDYEPVDEVVAFTPGSTSARVAVALEDDALDEDEETFALSLAGVESAGSTGEPLVVAIADDDASPAVSIEADAVVPERGPGISAEGGLAVRLDAPSGREVRVRFDSADGSATAEADYAPASGTLVFPAGVTERAAKVEVRGDALDEDDEGFSISLSDPLNATLDRGAGSVTIADDDDRPGMAIRDAEVDEGPEGATTEALLTVALDAPSGRAVAAEFATADGTAAAPADYAPAAGTVAFAPGETERTVTVTVAGDELDEPDERVAVELSGPTAATLLERSGAVTIRDDDEPPPPAAGGAAPPPAAGADAGPAAAEAPPPTAPPDPPPASDVTPPRLTALRIDRRFRVEPRPSLAATRRGARVSFELSEPARVELMVERRVAGVPAGRRCVPRRPGRRRRGRSCAAYQRWGTLTAAGTPGGNRVAFSGWLRGRRLSPGRCRLSVTAIDAAGNRSHSPRAGFRVLP